MSRARYLAGALAAGLALTLAACGGSDDSGDQAAQNAAKTDKLEIFSWWTSGSEDAALKELFGAFGKNATGVSITNGAVAGGGGGNAQAVLQTRLQGGNAPDSWQTHPGQAITQYVDADYVADLTAVQKRFGDAMPKALVDAQSKDGKVYGVSTGAHRGNVLWFSRKVLEDAGVVEPQDGYGFEQFTVDLAKLKAAGKTPLCVGAKDPFAAPQLFENTLLGAIGPEKWNAITTGKQSWDGPEVKQAANNYLKLLPFLDPDASASTWDQATKRIADGECGFESMGDWAYGELRKAGAKEGSDFGYVAHPGTDGSFVLVVDTFVVAKDAKNAKNAMAWVESLGSKEAQLAFNREKGSTPIRNDVDVSSYPKYQQEAAKAYRSDKPVWSIAHGQATSPQFQQSFYDAVTQFTQSKHVDAFVQALASAGT